MDRCIGLTRELMKCRSVTPEEGGAISLLQYVLDDCGFRTERLNFGGVENLYARYGKAGKNLCFAGHTDVVPPGEGWKHDPFGAVIEGGRIYGRGAADMKGAVAAFVCAAQKYAASAKGDFSISLLITGDEEGEAKNGTVKVLEALKSRGEKIDSCIVGEPTNPEKLGEMVKIGRRGSVTGKITVSGVQGHVAYPQYADNPVPKLIGILHRLMEKKLDAGTEFFDPSNLEITTIDVGNKAGNVIPAMATATLNIRFNDLHSSASLEKWVRETASRAKVEWSVTGEAFLTKPGVLSALMAASVKEITGISPALSTGGGTSDARFIKDFCPVVEFGLVNKTAHKVDEYAEIEDIKALQSIYERFLNKYFDA